MEPLFRLEGFRWLLNIWEFVHPCKLRHLLRYLVKLHCTHVPPIAPPRVAPLYTVPHTAPPTVPPTAPPRDAPLYIVPPTTPPRDAPLYTEPPTAPPRAVLPPSALSVSTAYTVLLLERLIMPVASGQWPAASYCVFGNGAVCVTLFLQYVVLTYVTSIRFKLPNKKS